jgi:hypothetical protein
VTEENTTLKMAQEIHVTEETEGVIQIAWTFCVNIKKHKKRITENILDATKILEKIITNLQFRGTEHELQPKLNVGVMVRLVTTDRWGFVMYKHKPMRTCVLFPTLAVHVHTLSRISSRTLRPLSQSHSLLHVEWSLLGCFCWFAIICRN